MASFRGWFLATWMSRDGIGWINGDGINGLVITYFLFSWGIHCGKNTLSKTNIAPKNGGFQ